MKKSNDELLKDAIADLHTRSSSNFQQLLRQAEKRKRHIQLNIPQAVAALSTARVLGLEWGRGTGKTTMLAQRVTENVTKMPRSTGLFIGPSYKSILTHILPSLVHGLELFGLYKDLHYFVGEQPPRSWRKNWGRAYEPPKRHEYYLTFWNGTGMHLISHDLTDDGRGLNTDWAIGDEAALLDPNKLQANTNATLRGTKRSAFDRCTRFGSQMYTSSTPLTPEGTWFLEYEEKAMNNPKEINFMSATCEYNLHNLREGYLKEAEQDAYAQWVFLAEYKNVRPKFAKDAFYPLLDADIHLYTSYDYTHYSKLNQAVDCRGDADLVKGMPLIIAMDFGAAINCLTVNQYLRSINEYRTLKSMFVLGMNKQTQDDLMQNMHEYYKHHQASCDMIHLYYDRTGNHRTGITRRTRAQQAAAYLRSKGWKVQLLTKSMNNPDHEKKYILWNRILKEDDHRLPRYRMNKENCKELYISMRHAKTQQGRSGIQKDKRSEKSSKIPRQHSTDLSDANDLAIFDLFYHLLDSHGAILPDLRVTTQ
jgi:hypothetical protein